MNPEPLPTPLPAGGALSAYELGKLLGDALPRPDSVDVDELALVDAARSLLDAIVRTAADHHVRATHAVALRRIADDLCSTHRADLVRLVRHPDGRIENLLQAAAGRCNPRSLLLRFDDMRPPPSGVVDLSATVSGHVVLDVSATGPPGRAHGGIVSTILDEALGVAVMRAGRTGMTAAIDVSFRGPVPIGVELDIAAWVDRVDGRKTHAEAELRVDAVVVATARGLFVASRPPVDGEAPAGAAWT